MRFIQGFFMSFGMFCAIPCPYRPWNEKARDLMIIFLPVVGLVIGILWYALYYVLDLVNLPLQLQAAILMLYPFLVTGFIHLDGYMDTMDAILSRRPLEEKLRILKDPHTGAFAVISVAILFILCYAAMSAVVENIHLEGALSLKNGNSMLSLILIPAATRCCSALAVLKGKPLQHSQYGSEFKKNSNPGEAIFVLFLAVLCIAGAIFIGTLAGSFSYTVLIIMLVTFVAYSAAIFYSANQLGGISGDLAGYSLTIAEAAAIVTMALF